MLDWLMVMGRKKVALTIRKIIGLADGDGKKKSFSLPRNTFRQVAGRLNIVIQHYWVDMVKRRVRLSILSF
jgi:hypothetical protein